MRMFFLLCWRCEIQREEAVGSWVVYFQLFKSCENNGGMWAGEGCDLSSLANLTIILFINCKLLELGLFDVFREIASNPKLSNQHALSKLSRQYPISKSDL